MEIFRSSRVLGAYRRDYNLEDSLVQSSFQSSMNAGMTQMEPFSVAFHVVRPAPTPIQRPRSTPLVDH